jgi:hypothetical protein
MPHKYLLVQQCRKKGDIAKTVIFTLNINAASDLHRFFIMLPCNGQLVITPFARHLDKNRIFGTPLQQPVLIGDKTRDQFDGIAKKNIMLILARCHAMRSENLGSASLPMTALKMANSDRAFNLIQYNILWLKQA